jgi:hypothetical protein
MCNGQHYHLDAVACQCPGSADAFSKKTLSAHTHERNPAGILQESTGITGILIPASNQKTEILGMPINIGSCEKNLRKRNPQDSRGNLFSCILVQNNSCAKKEYAT